MTYFTALLALIAAGCYAFWKLYMPSTDNKITVVPITVPVPPVSPKLPLDKVRTCAMTQQHFEGWYPGSNSYIRNNPGNLRSVQGPFLVFPTYELGFAALEKYITNVATGKHKAYPKGGKTTILEYTHIYTSDKEPAPTNYAIAIARDLGISTDTTMDWLLS